MKEKEEGYEYKNLKICRRNIQRESCRDCLFEVLCRYEDNKAKNEGKEIEPRFINNLK